MYTITSTALLEGLAAPGNQRVWTDFCNRYQPVLIAFGRRLGLSSADAQDAAQETLLTFANAYREGKYDRSKGRLSTWLLTIARNKVIDMQRRGSREAVAAGQEMDKTDQLHALPDDQSVNDIWEAEWKRAIVQQCLDEVRREVEPDTMRAFELVALQDWPADKVAEHLNMSRNSVYLAKSRVLARMREIQVQLEETW